MVRLFNEGKTAAWAAVLLAACLLAGLPDRPARSTPPVTPSPPQWIAVSDLGGKVGLSWVHDGGHVLVRVYRLVEKAGGEPVLLGESAGNSFVDADVRGGVAYVYFLVALGEDGGESAPSARMGITPRAPAVRLLSAPVWEGSVQTARGIGLKWRPAEGELPIAYNVYRRSYPENAFSLAGSTVSPQFEDRSAEPGKVHTYKVTALNSDFREGPFSEELALAYVPDSVLRERAREMARGPRKSRLLRLVEEGDQRLFRPADVVVDASAELVYLSDSGSRAVHLYDLQGGYLRTFRREPDGNFLFGNVLGLGLDRQGNLLAVDAARGAVLEMDRTGRTRGLWDLKAHMPGRPLGLIDAVSTGDGELAVVDNLNGRILIHHPDAPLRSMGETGAGPGQLSAPAFCTLDRDGRLYVSDAMNGRIQVYDRSGVLLRSFGVYGRGPGGLGRPKGVAVSEGGEVYVADSWQNAIQVFSREGDYLGPLTDEKGESPDLGSPNGIAFGPGNRLYISERLAGRLQIREVLGGGR